MVEPVMLVPVASPPILALMAVMLAALVAILVLFVAISVVFVAMLFVLVVMFPSAVVTWISDYHMIICFTSQIFLSGLDILSERGYKGS